MTNEQILDLWQEINNAFACRGAERDTPVIVQFARALESRASNAGGAVWIQRDHLEKAKTGAYLCRVEAEYRDGMGFVPLYPAPASKEPVADERDMALRWATQLAESIWRKHYANEALEWKPMPDLVGVISQIDNMSTGLVRAKTGDRAMLESISQDLEISWHYCERCGHGEPCKNMDAAYMLRDYLAAAPAKPEGV